MAQDDLDDAEDSGARAAQGAAGGGDQPSGKSKWMALILPAVTLIVGLVIGGGSGYLASGYLGSGAVAAPEAHSAAAAPVDDKKTPSVYINLPKVQVNLASDRCRGLYLRLELAAEVGGEEAAAATRSAQAIITDRVTAFIRSQTKDNIDGRAGTDRFRANVIAIVNDAIQPHQARNVLFREFLVQ